MNEGWLWDLKFIKSGPQSYNASNMQHFLRQGKNSKGDSETIRASSLDSKGGVYHLGFNKPEDSHPKQGSWPHPSQSPGEVANSTCISKNRAIQSKVKSSTETPTRAKFSRDAGGWAAGTPQMHTLEEPQVYHSSLGEMLCRLCPEKSWGKDTLAGLEGGTPVPVCLAGRASN